MTATEQSGMTHTDQDQAELLLAAAERACRRAGEGLREEFRTELTSRAKGAAHDVVTEADARAETLIRQELHAAFPDSTVVGEEGGSSGEGEIHWYVDPIDGTYNFLRGLPYFCTSIGVRIAGRPVAGCVYDPVHEEMFSATAGGGFRLNGRAQGASSAPSGTLAGARSETSAPLPLVLTDIPSAGRWEGAEEEIFTGLLRSAADVRRVGSSALTLAYVACGRADLAANADVMAWDIEAGRVLVTEAGGGFRALPDPPLTRERGCFVAWRQGFEEQGRRTARELAALGAASRR